MSGKTRNLRSPLAICVVLGALLVTIAFAARNLAADRSIDVAAKEPEAGTLP